MLNINCVTFFLLLISIFQYSASAAESISRQKCREYGQNINNCHISNENVVQYGQFPHIVLVGYKVDNEVQYKCSGVLISDQYILTTSYCGRPKSAQVEKVKLGALNFENDTNETHIQEIKITNVIVHPMHKNYEKYNDISLLKLEHPVEINEYVRPACLPDLNEKHETYILTGWEVFDNIESEIPLTAHYNISEISNENCRTFYESHNRSLKNGIDAVSHFCAGPSEIVCKMLGGAPLQTLDKSVDCMYDIHAIASFGKSCPSPVPTIFTKLAPFIKWIENTIWP